ncbi:MAG TPA: ABC transporter ATP-binding protein [candidate division Zixibacteria bacterium]|nr:ABC transporter ATP-binding protein [candidate division Zixibacteria bacterium]
MSETKPNAVIVTEGVTKTYEDNGVPVKAVKGIDLTVERGEFTAIVGPSGSGKTTFLNIISGLDTVTEGKVWLDGKLLSEMSGRELSDFRRDNIGFIFQAYNLIPVLSVRENVEYVMLLQSIPADERKRRVDDILAQVGLADYADRLPTKLSGGQQQRVAVARAMVSRPVLVLADEPTANLDSKTGADLLDMMRDLNRSTGMTFLFSTHDNMIMERAARLVTLKDGLIDSDEVRE